MDIIEALNRRYASIPGIRFRQLTDGINVLDVDNGHANATISLYGGQVLLWQP